MKKKCYSMRTIYTTTRGEATLSTILVSRQFSRIAMIQLDFFLAPLVLSGTNHHTSCMTSIYEFCSWHPFLPRHWYSKCKMSRPIYNILNAEYHRIKVRHGCWVIKNVLNLPDILLLPCCHTSCEWYIDVIFATHGKLFESW